MENTTARQDNTLQGWSWIEGTFSWIEPTSWCLLALKKSPAVLHPRERSARIDEAERLLLDRVCRTGGWNYGNSNVLGQELHAHVPTTALALLALQDRREHPSVQKSLEYLVRQRLSEPAGMALALTSICLRVDGVPAADVDERLAAIAERHAFFNNLHIAAMCSTATAWRTRRPTQRKDGTWRMISLTATDPTYKVRARPGYEALHPPPVRASIEFTATDQDRGYLEIRREDLEIIEDGVMQHVDVFQEAVAPVAMVLAVDASGSMTRAAGIAREAAAHFVDAVRAGDRLGLVQFADKAELVADLQITRDGAHEALANYTPKGGTALYDALQLSMQRLKGVDGRRVVVVVTDGRDENAASKGPGSVATWEMVIEAAQATDVTVYAIGVGSRVDRGRLQKLADLTGGDAYFAEDIATLDAEYRRVVEDLHRRYVLGYTSTNGTRDGAWRSVELRSPGKAVRLRSRGGYFAPEH
jgi:VWFA-related protein